VQVFPQVCIWYARDLHSLTLVNPPQELQHIFAVSVIIKASEVMQYQVPGE
jgi:hypothetical protein